jgi:sulfite exporter TauE/SafE
VIFTTFILGLMGSLHCAGMCGPLVLLTPVVPGSPIASRLTYHAGRISVYALLGLLFGAIGESIVLAGFQRWLSIIVGVLMLAIIPLKGQLTRAPYFVKKLFGRFLQQRTFPSILALGATNGLLPCGLVYVAATASVANADILQSSLSMITFGLGTLPMLLGISFARQRVNPAAIPLLRRLVPWTVAVAALLLIVRGDPISLWKGDAGQARCPVCAR